MTYLDRSCLQALLSTTHIYEFKSNLKIIAYDIKLFKIIYLKCKVADKIKIFDNTDFLQQIVRIKH